jgi:putative ABC transport system permease protein
MFNQTSLSRMLIETQSHDQLAGARIDVLGLLKTRHDNEEDVTAVTQESMLATFSRLLGVLTAALTGIAAISLSVAGVGIMNVMLVSVSERTREIGLLKAIGATSGQVMRVFLAEASMLSVAGGLVGVLLAALLTALARRLYPDFPMQPPPWALPAAMVVSLSVGILFGVLPARRAARLDPIMALTRH